MTPSEQPTNTAVLQFTYYIANRRWRNNIPRSIWTKIVRIM